MNKIDKVLHESIALVGGRNVNMFLDSWRLSKGLVKGISIDADLLPSYNREMESKFWDELLYVLKDILPQEKFTDTSRASKRNRRMYVDRICENGIRTTQLGYFQPILVRSENWPDTPPLLYQIGYIHPKSNVKKLTRCQLDMISERLKSYGWNNTISTIVEFEL